MPKNFNSKTVADRVAAPLDLTLLSAVAAAEDATARLDERLHKSPLRDGFLARGHFAALALRSGFPANSSISRTSSSMTPRWTCARPPMSSLAPTPRYAPAAASPLLPGTVPAERRRLPEEGEPRAEEGPDPPIDEDDPLAADLAALDAAVARSTKLLRESPAAAPGRELVYAEDFREEARLATRRREVKATDGLAPTLAAAVALDAWRAIELLERQS